MSILLAKINSIFVSPKVVEVSMDTNLDKSFSCILEHEFQKSTLPNAYFNCETLDKPFDARHGLVLMSNHEWHHHTKSRMLTLHSDWQYLMRVVVRQLNNYENKLLLSFSIWVSAVEL